MGETNSPSVAHVGYDISPLSRVKLKNLTTRLFFVVLENGVAILSPSICGLIYCTRLVSSILIVKGLKLKYQRNIQGSVVELVIKLIIWLALITFLIPNHIVTYLANAMIQFCCWTVF